LPPTLGRVRRASCTAGSGAALPSTPRGVASRLPAGVYFTSPRGRVSSVAPLLEG